MISKKSKIKRNLAHILRPLSVMAMLAVIALPGVARAEDDKFVDTEGGGDYLQKLSGLAVHGFANMGWADDSSTDNHRRYSRGFYLNNFDIYFNPDLGNRVRFLSEIVFEPDSENQQPAFDAERLQAGYVVNKNLTIWIGRFHTPIGYYTIAYHHGMQLQTAVDKPRFMDFEDHFGVLPVHSNGLWLNGSTVVGEQRLGLQAWLSNSDRIVTDGAGFSSLDFDMGHADNHHLAYGARAQWTAGGSLDGLQIGATVLGETIDYMGTGETTYGATGGVTDTSVNPNTGGTFSSKFLMYGMHAVYEAHGIEFLNEIYGFSNSNALVSNGPTYSSAAGYSQLAYWINGISAPFIRYERGSFNKSDPYFAGQYNGLPYSKGALGYRYNLNDNSALKVELSRTTFNGSSNTNVGQAFNDVHIDYSIRF